MKRRDVIKLGAVAAGATAGVPGCAVPRPLAGMTGAAGAAEFNAMLDHQLERMARPGLLQALVRAEASKARRSSTGRGAAGEPMGAGGGTARTPETAARLAEQDALFRRMLGTLLVTQGFRELPAETQLEPAVQERMWRHLDEIGETVFEVTESLAALDEAQRANLRRTLAARPDLPMDLGEVLDAQAAGAGLSAARRMQLRKMMSQTAFRLRHGDPGSIIDEYVDKVQRVEASTAQQGEALRLAKQLGERSFWKHQRMIAAQDPQVPPGGGGAGAPAPAPAPGPAPAPATAPAPARVARPPLVETLTRSARAAAQRGDCRTVDALRARVMQLDPAYYRDEFAPDPVIRSCRQGVDLRPPSGQPAAPAAPAPAAMEPPTPRPRPGARGLRVGGYMLGIGLVTFGVSAALVSSSEAFLFGMTVGAILFSIGLIALLISALIMAMAD